MADTGAPLPEQWTGHPREHDLRQIVNGILHPLRSGCQWWMLPNDLPPWLTIQYYFRNWSYDGAREAPLHPQFHGID